jgi:hypothetical protein
VVLHIWVGGNLVELNRRQRTSAQAMGTASTRRASNIFSSSLIPTRIFLQTRQIFVSVSDSDRLHHIHFPASIMPHCLSTIICSPLIGRLGQTASRRESQHFRYDLFLSPIMFINLQVNSAQDSECQITQCVYTQPRR